MADMLTTKEAAEVTGIVKFTLLDAIRAGRLRATRTPCGGGYTYLIAPSDLGDYLAGYRKLHIEQWDEADELALVELYGTASLPQVAKYLRRTHSSVKNKVRKMLRDGRLVYHGKNSPLDYLGFLMPRRAILLAKTCLKCGKLRDASYYTRMASANTTSECLLCRRQIERKRRGGKSDPVTCAEQKASLQLAKNLGRPYTQAEVKSIMDPSKSVFELAIELGRSVYAITGKRHRMGFNPKGPRRELPDSQWQIRFPNAMKALREQYRALGVVPESEWDWNDEGVA